jgi:transcriptional antiterminator RfaH
MKCWYLLYCKVGYKSTAQRIESLGVEVFRPTIVKISPRKDCHAVRHSEQALFPSYLFLCFDINKVHTSSVSKVPGAVSFVRFGNLPCTIPEKIVHALKCSPRLSRDRQDHSVDCRNIHPQLLSVVDRIADMPASEAREIALISLMDAVNRQKDDHGKEVINNSRGSYSRNAA